MLMQENKRNMQYDEIIFVADEVVKTYFIMNESENKVCTSTRIIKHKKGKALNSGERNIVLNVFNKFCEMLSAFLLTIALLQNLLVFL